MKASTLLAILLFSLNARAVSLCGLYQSEDFRDGVVVSLIDFLTYPNLAKSYTITNPSDFKVTGMVSGQCYCVQGEVAADPDFSGDSMYQRLTVTQIDRGPYIGCLP